MAKSLLELGVNTGQWDAGLKKAQSALNSFVQANGGLQNALQKDNGDMLKFVQMMGKMDSTADTAKGKMNDYRRVLERLTADFNALNAAQKKGVEGQTYMASIDSIKAKFQAASAEVAKFNQSLGLAKLDGGGLGIGSSIGGALKSFGPAALAAGGVMAAMNGLKSAMSDMVSINMQFEQSSATLAAIMGKTRGETAALTEQAKQLGATTQYTAVQITELQTNLARLGFSEQEILNSTKAVQALATATGADLGEAANLAGAALRGFGMNAAEMDRVASVLAVSTTKSALSFEKLATSVPIVAPVAKQFGFTVEDTVTLLGKLSDAGFDASSAATATRNIFLNLANGSGKLAQALGRPVRNVEEFGDALVDLRAKGIDLAEMLELTDKRSVAAFATFVDNAQTLRDFKASITDCSDALDGMVNEQLNTLQGSVTIMKSAWEGLMLTFSESTGVLKDVTDGLTSLLQAWTNWNKRRQGGDAAISTYEIGMTDDQRKGAQAIVAGYRAGGMKDEEIKLKIEADTKPLVEARDKAKALYDQLKDIQNAGQQQAWNKAFRDMFPEYNVGQHGAAPNYIAQQIAAQNDAIARQDYMASLVTPASVGVAAGSGANGEGGADKKTTARLKAQYEAEEKEQIAALDRMSMNEADYEAKVYEIKRASLEKIAKLYNKDTAERARANAALSQLDIQYQGTQMRLSNRQAKEDAKYQVQVGIGGYSTEGIKQLKQEIENELNRLEIGSEGYLIQADRLADLNSFQNLLKTAVQNGLQLDPMQLEGLFDDIDLGLNVPDSAWAALVDEINTQLAALNLPPIKLDVKTGGVKEVTADVNTMKSSWTAAASAVAQVGSAMQSIDDPTAKIAGIVAEAIASVAAGLGQMLAQPQATSEAWGWVALALSGTATMISTIAAIKQATKFEHGGMVPGNSFTGDNIVARLNSGEGVLTAKGVQNAANMASSLSGRGSAPSTTPYVTGEMILLGANNYLARSGQGEIVTTGMLRRAGINL